VTRIRRFIAEAVSELKKVSWPTFAQTRQLTVLVFGVSLAVGIYVFVFDRLFQGIIGLLTKAIG
jgi:preprotein translocase SecE subunit